MTDVERRGATATQTFVMVGLDTPAAPEPASERSITATLQEHGGVLSSDLRHHEVLATFASTAAGVTAALAVQREAAQVPIGVHSAETRSGDPDVVAVRRCARLRDIARGGQILLSAGTASLVADLLPDGARLVDLGTHRLRDLSRPEHVYELRHPDLPAVDAPPSSLDMIPNTLPSQLTSFVGREGELHEVQKLLGEQRLVTLAGPGGCGKTRLAAQAAAELADRWMGGVWWVDLSSITDPALVAGAVASAAGVLVDPASGPLPALAAQLRDRRVLICLDTCEHLLDPCAELVDTVLRRCPDVSVLATSREPLGVPGEAVWRVPPLASNEAARLFTERAALVRTGFTGDRDGAAVRTICERLDGIPLAIELAAAWVRALSPADIAARLDDRFRLLVGGPRVVADRHRTLAASIGWSHDLLDDADRVLIRRLSVFVGGFTVAAAAAVCADDRFDVLDAIGRLVDKSLVVVVERADEGVRYRMLDTIREYAQERLRAAGETSELHDRHLDHFLGFAEAAEPELERDQDRWRLLLEAEHDNLHAALRWGLAAPDPERGRQLAAALARFWYLHGHIQEGLAFLSRAIELAPGDRSVMQASLLSGLGIVAMGAGLPATADDAAQRGLDIAAALGDDRNRGRCLMVAAYMQFFADPAGMRELAFEAERHAAIAGDQMVVDKAEILVARAFTNRDRHAEAVAAARPVFERTSSRGERGWAALALAVEVRAALFTGDLRRAEELARDALALAEPLGDYCTVGYMTYNVACVLGMSGRIDAAHALFDPILRAAVDAGKVVGLDAWFALMPAKLHLWNGDLDDAVRWFESAARFGERVPDNWVVAQALPGLAEAMRRQGHLEHARSHADRALAIGTKLDIPHVRAEALAELARLATAGQDPAGAEDLHHRALAIRVGHGLRTFWVDSLDALAGLAAATDRPADAARLLAAVDTARTAMSYPRPPVGRPEHDALVAAVRGALRDDTFTDAWANGERLSLDDAITYATRSRGSRARPATGWASLTPAEREVVELITAGLSNPEIGARLFMSRSTVKTHLAHVFGKLGVANRTELATLAARHRANR